MKKNFLGISILILCFCVSGCGKNNNNKPDTIVSSITSSPTVETDNNGTLSKATSHPSPEVYTEPEETAKPEETVEPEIIKLSPKQAYSDTQRMVSILGLKEYKKIKGDSYTDTPKKGKNS